MKVILLTLALVISAVAFAVSSPPATPGPASTASASQAKSHWAFQPLPYSASNSSPRSIDDLIRHQLKGKGLRLGPEANRLTLIRRVAFIVTGLPPTPEEIVSFQADRKAGAYRRMFERYLASPRHGERWAQHWLDAAGYADSNGYFSADTDRPLAYRYRDYVIRALNRDRPFDQFVREQLAGDELSGWKPGQAATPAIIEQLEATHYLRNGQDGSGESDGNPDEVRTDRYYALESAMQIVGSSLLGLTLQCAKCHDHKFEPITQLDYYGLQAVLYPAFNIEKWVKPNDRVTQANLPGEFEAWSASEKQLDIELATAQIAFRSWASTNHVPGRILFTDQFEAVAGTNLRTHGQPVAPVAPVALSERWTNIAPGDDVPAGSNSVSLDSQTPPAARVENGALQIIEGGGSGDRWLCTKETFNWRPAATGQWIQVTFDLVATKLGNGKSAERIGYLIAAHDFNDNSPTPGGNLLIDGNPDGATAVHLDYPGADSKTRGNIGSTGYRAGHNYGLRITSAGSNDFTLEHLVDGAVDGASLRLRAEHLPPGAFAFEYCCGRSFVVDNVVVERSDDAVPEWRTANEAFQRALAEHKQGLDRTTKNIAARRNPKPGRIAWTSDAGANIPTVRFLKRGNPKTPGDPVEPSVPAFLAATAHRDDATLKPAAAALGTGRRSALAQWVTEPGSPQASLLARVTVNRVWQQYFGVGLVATPDNFGLSGAKPTHPALLDELATRFIDSGWSLKALHTLILDSATFRQSSAPRKRGLSRDPENHYLWRYSLRRLDADAIRDAMLAVSGRLGSKTNGPYVPTPRGDGGEVAVDESKPDAFARTVFLQHRRTQVPTFLGNFDAPSVVFNCARRTVTTMPLQSLSLLNSDFSVKRGKDLAQRLGGNVGPDSTAESKIRRGFILSCGREPAPAELRAAVQFVNRQRECYADQPDADARAWADLGQSLFALNAFLYLE